MVESNGICLMCVSNDVRIFGILTVESEEAGKAEEALRKLVRVMGEALDCEVAKCDVEEALRYVCEGD